MIAAFAIPAVATAAYFLSGATALEDRPYAARETERVAAGLPSDAEAMLIEQLAASVNKRPSDPRGWSLLGNGYFREARYGQAAAAYRNALSHGATDASVASALGESLVLGSDGQVTSDAHDAFRQALALDASDPKARYFLALEQLQGGHAEDAIKSWQEMLRTAPADAPWKELVRGAIEAAKSPAVSAFDRWERRVGNALQVADLDREQALSARVFDELHEFARVGADPMVIRTRKSTRLDRLGDEIRVHRIQRHMPMVGGCCSG